MKPKCSAPGEACLNTDAWCLSVGRNMLPSESLQRFEGFCASKWPHVLEKFESGGMLPYNGVWCKDITLMFEALVASSSHMLIPIVHIYTSVFDFEHIWLKNCPELVELLTWTVSAILSSQFLWGKSALWRMTLVSEAIFVRFTTNSKLQNACSIYYSIIIYSF